MSCPSGTAPLILSSGEGVDLVGSTEVFATLAGDTFTLAGFYRKPNTARLDGVTVKAVCSNIDIMGFGPPECEYKIEFCIPQRVTYVDPFCFPGDCVVDDPGTVIDPFGLVGPLRPFSSVSKCEQTVLYARGTGSSGSQPTIPITSFKSLGPWGEFYEVTQDIGSSWINLDFFPADQNLPDLNLFNPNFESSLMTFEIQLCGAPL